MDFTAFTYKLLTRAFISFSFVHLYKIVTISCFVEWWFSLSLSGCNCLLLPWCHCFSRIIILQFILMSWTLRIRISLDLRFGITEGVCSWAFSDIATNITTWAICWLIIKPRCRPYKFWIQKLQRMELADHGIVSLSISLSEVTS